MLLFPVSGLTTLLVVCMAPRLSTFTGISKVRGIFMDKPCGRGGASGVYVTAPAGSPNVLANAQPMPDFDHIYVKVSNKEGASFNDFGNNTYFMKFEKAGGGLNSLHITTDPRNPSGNVNTTSNLSGTFYVDFTGDRVQDDFVLLVAVNGTVGDDFQLNLKSSVPS